MFYTLRLTNALKSLVFWQDEKPWYLKKEINCLDFWVRRQKRERIRKNLKRILGTTITRQKHCTFLFFVKYMSAAVSFHDDVTVIYGLFLLLNLVQTFFADFSARDALKFNMKMWNRFFFYKDQKSWVSFSRQQTGKKLRIFLLQSSL